MPLILSLLLLPVDTLQLLLYEAYIFSYNQYDIIISCWPLEYVTEEEAKYNEGVAPEEED